MELEWKIVLEYFRLYLNEIVLHSFLILSVLQDGDGSQRYDDGICEEEFQCSICNFHHYPRATLRGICRNDWTDIFYTLLFDEETNLPYYKGDTGTVILYDEGDHIWKMVHDPDNGLMGTGQALLDNMGTGVQMWKINQDICGDGNMGPVLGLLTVCKVRRRVDVAGSV